VTQILPSLGRAASGLLAQALRAMPGDAPRRVVLELRGDYPVTRPGGPLSAALAIGQRAETLGDLRRRLERLASAPDIEGVVLVLREFSGGLATAYAIRRLLERYRSVGKTVDAYAEVVSGAALYIASAADRFAVLEHGEWTANGLAARVVFLREALEKLGLNPEFVRRAEYKSAPERFTERGFSESHREALGAVLDDLYAHWVEEVARGRHLEPAAVRAAVDAAPLTPPEARERGLVDALEYEDEVTLGAKPWRQAARFAPPELAFPGPEGVALVSLTGAIMPGESRNVPVPLPLFGGPQAGSTSVARALRAAAQNPRVKAVVFHVDSGGGSPMASEVIWREVARTRDAKPVVAVMGDLAASGGYYVLCGADRVVAAPSTITGSIGVFGGKLDASALWARLGLHPETITRGEHADDLSPDRPLDAGARERLEKQVDRIYATFKARVAQGRGLSEARVEEVARGRIWSGARALEIGLVDRLGTVYDALDLARELGGLPADAPVFNVTPPRAFVAPTDLDALVRHAARVASTSVWAAVPFRLEWR
jgi:protease-4